MPLSKRKKSVTKNIVYAMSLIVLLSVATTSFAIYTLTSSLNDAEAVNVSGSMRMQSYRLAHDIQIQSSDFEFHIQQFEQSIFSESMQSLDDWRVPDHIANDYQLLIKRWQELKTVLEGEQPQRYLPLVASFVKQIDDFVLKLQIFSEQKITKLTVVGGLGLGGIVLASIYVVLYVRREIVYPLNELAIASERIQNRSFDVELSHESKTEMGVLTRTFSNMAKDLGKLYRGLEQAVDEKTQELQKANTSLHVLYRSSQELADARINIDNFQAILRHIVSIDSIGKVQLDIDDDDSSVSLYEGEAEQAEVIHRELYLDGEHLGSLHFYCIQDAPERTLLDNFAQILARAIFYNQAQRQAEQLLLAEERATIARELHDSLAQSLSYLKIQVALLKKQMTKLEMSSGAANTVIELDTGLSDAYTQLRELLTTFRLTIKEGNFGVALKEMLSQLDDQTSAMIVLENGLSSVELDAHQQVHLLQLIREATINAMKHADAGRIQVSCSEEQGEIVVSVADNGIGFGDGEAKINHYGMSIMRERAERLNGQLTVNSQHDSGTEVRLVFSLGTS
ncbi:nitrate/nitrite two-component system sensor histidine kinase NarQ [Vibrio agarivorans]|uniref:nitrate/nitrite two-component system sensor histidine kinase NarQ n=1 Tax=Vibrio agarivorans TaxID=153622 RepID=UPI00223166C5|nr:nitrate/nitrite two-component system sensor histidine kinase NarQ [Vibrio agarivorans]MDN3660997.1 nitrate/nitrite two-component system sensor histidine kinase NarQ [Vibrio agarivorans]